MHLNAALNNLTELLLADEEVDLKIKALVLVAAVGKA